MSRQFKLAASAAGLSVFALTAGCGGGGGGGDAPPPTPLPVNNRAPTLTSTAVAVNEDGATTAQLTATDPDNNPVTFALTTNSQHGNASLTAAGLLSYAPAANYSGTDTLVVTVSDNAGAQAPGTITVTVAPLNDTPEAHDDTLRVTATPGQNVTIAALTNDIDVDGDALTPTVVTQPRGGTVTVNATTRQLTFEPANNFTGPIEFSYRVNDGTTMSNTATVRAVIGDFQGVAFLSDYTRAGVPEVHVFDGLELRRASDALPPGARVASYSISGDLKTLAYVVDSNEADRVYVKPLDGSAAAELRYTSALKSSPAGRQVRVTLNADGTYMSVDDEWLGSPKHLFIVNTTTGASTQIGALMPGIIDTGNAIFHPLDPRLVMVQGQTAGTVPRNSSNFAATAFIGDAADTRTLTQIGANYSAGTYAADYFLYGRDTHYLYFNERPQAGASLTVNLIAYDRTSGARIPIVRFASAPDRGFNFPGLLSPDLNRLCFWFYEPTTTAFNGPSQLYGFDIANPASALAAGPVLSGIETCGFASDNRTMVYRVKPPASTSLQTFKVDSLTSGASVPLAPAAETGSEQGSATLAPLAMRIAISFFNNDGIDGYQGQIGRFYSLPLDGSGDAFLFSDTYVSEFVTSGTFDSSDDGSYLLYARPRGGINALELMSTRGLNLSIPLSRNSETTGVTSARWLQRFP